MKKISEFPSTDLPQQLHKQTFFDWGRKGLRTRNGFRFRGGNGRRRCYFDPAWLHKFEKIMASAGHARLLRKCGSLTSEWVAVAKRSGAFWPIYYYLIPKRVVELARQELTKHTLTKENDR
ncbi:MAG: hypothetical protein SFX18_15835 [Pirellulales bacterium]|nr:hypothetical protein [Pirellulales bacterium]